MGKKGKKSVELKFLSSLALLLGSLMSIFFLLKVLTPPESSKNQDIAKKQEIASDQLRVVARNSFHTKDSSSSLVIASAGSSSQTESKIFPAKDQIDLHSIDALLSDAMRLIDEAKPQAALSILEKILEQDPQNEVALVEAAMVHLIDLKDSAGAVPFLEKAIKVNSGNKIVLAELMSVYEELDQSEQGAQFLQKVYDEHPESSQLAIGLGQLYLDLDKPQEAVQVLERSAQEDATDPDVWSQYAQALMENHQMDKAVEGYERALAVQIQREESGYYDNQPSTTAQEKVALARLDLIAALLMDKNETGAQKQLELLKKDLPEEALSVLIDQFKQKGETGASRL